jgi:hypothetical protein
MSQQNYITSFCSIQAGQVNINHSIAFSEQQILAPVEFLKSAYKHYQLNYAKFYKMDNLCKLAFITSELLLKNNPVMGKYKKEDIAIITANSSSSMDIDQEHQQTITDKTNYFPSPSAFVYTLPNILIAEIAIKNGIKGENAFFIFDTFNALFMSEYVNSLLNTGKATCCIAGWVDFYETQYQAFLYTVEKQPGILNTKHNPEALEKLFLH